MTIVEFLTARLDEEAWWATEASRRERGGHTPTGEHWHWECGDDHDVTPEPLTQEYLECAEGNFSVSLRSIEEYPTYTVGPLPHFALSYCEEVPAVVAGHIIRHDPASVLADIESKRAVVAHMERRRKRSQFTTSDLEVLCILAARYRDHADWSEEWAVIPA